MKHKNASFERVYAGPEMMGIRPMNPKIDKKSFCQNCGSLVSAEAKFCSQCGFRLKPAPTYPTNYQETPIEARMVYAGPPVDVYAGPPIDPDPDDNE